MNIVKLKDTIMPEACSFAKLFNEKLKGRYAYWIQMRYIFPLDSIDYKTYIKYEQLDDIDFLKPDMIPHIDLYTEECCMYEFSYKYIDQEATGNANIIRVNEYKIENNYVTDSDISISELKDFRSWLAGEILSINSLMEEGQVSILSDEQVHMFDYYKNDMYNETIKHLMTFGNENIVSSDIIDNLNNGCGCKANSNINPLYTITTSLSCNALDIYTKNLHVLMVKTFEDINFWLKFNKSFISIFKKYIDNIIKTNLIIADTNDSNIYIICNCNKSNYAENTILKNLSESLQYIITDDYKGHQNFIYDSLYNWAEKLYDKMSWKIK